MASSGEIAVRPLGPRDLRGIAGVHQRACSIAYRFMGWSYSEAQVRRWYATKRADWDWGRVALHGDDIVAFAAAIRGHLDQLFVDPACQRGGIGRTLLQAMLDRGIRPVTLTVYAENLPARAFYATFGFREVGANWSREDRAVELLYRLD